MDVGLELRQAREQRGMSLHQISNETKISLRVLQAIEKGNESALPAKVFTRSFVKSYATLVGLDPAETADRYLEQIEPPAPTQTVEGAGEANPDTSLQHPDTLIRRIVRVLQGRFGTATVLALTAISAAALVVRNYRQAKQVTTPHASAPLVSAPTPAPPPAAAPAQQSAAVGTSGTATPIAALRLAIAPTGPCWIRATVDGHAVFAKLLAAGDRQEIDAPSDVTLRVGNPAAFAFTINGAPARISAAPGQPATVRITKENYSRFLTR
jgi:cytoskeletal protein RodZ